MPGPPLCGSDRLLAGLLAESSRFRSESGLKLPFLGFGFAYFSPFLAHARVCASITHPSRVLSTHPAGAHWVSREDVGLWQVPGHARPRHQGGAMSPEGSGALESARRQRGRQTHAVRTQGGRERTRPPAVTETASPQVVPLWSPEGQEGPSS